MPESLAQESTTAITVVKKASKMPLAILVLFHRRHSRPFAILPGREGKSPAGYQSQLELAE